MLPAIDRQTNYYRVQDFLAFPDPHYASLAPVCFRAEVVVMWHFGLARIFSPRSVLPHPKRPQGSVRHVGILRDDHLGDLVYTLPMLLPLTKRGIRVSLFLTEYTQALAQHYVASLPASGQALVQIFDNAALARQDVVQDMDALLVPLGKSMRRHKEAVAQARAAGALVVTRAQLANLWRSDAVLYFPAAYKHQLHEAQMNLAFLRPILGDLQQEAELAAIPGEINSPALNQIDLALFHGAPWQQASQRLVLHLGSHGNGREWPLQRFFSLIQALTAKPGVAIWLTGSAAEGERVRQQLPELWQMPGVHPVFAAFSLTELMALIRHADGFVANGTGPLHLAGLLGTPNLGLFPHAWSIGAARWRPLSARSISLSATHCEQHCAKACRCIEQISVEQVFTALQTWRKPD